MTTDFADGFTMSSMKPSGARHTKFVLSLVICALLGPGTLSVDETTSLPAAKALPAAETYDALLERVRTEPLLDLSDPRFIPALVMGHRQGGILTFTVGFHDPMNPNILRDDFANWNLCARASLLLSYARLVTDSDKPRPYVGLPDKERRSLVAHDAEETARTRRMVHSGGYMDSWKPFAVAYRKLAESVEEIVPPGDTPPTDTKTAELIAGLAQQQGVFRLIRELPIDPADVTNEILRVLHESRISLGGASSVSDDGPNLLYACGGNPLAVRVHPWHSLAPAFFRAAEAAAEKTTDPHALLIMTMFAGISDDINAWTATHPDATPAARDSKLNQLAKTRGLYSLLQK